MVDTLSSAISSEPKKITDVVKFEVDQTHCRIEGALGGDAGLEIGDIVELISSVYVKVETAANAAGIFLSRKDTALRYATADLTFGANASATDIVTVNARVYTYIATVGTDDDIDVGSDADASLDNLMACINLGVGSGSEYQASTAHTTVSAEIRTGDTLRFRSLLPGSVGNSYTLTTDVTGATVTEFSGGAAVDPAKGTILTRGPATVDGNQLDYNGATVADVDGPLLILGIKVIT